jgi:hypothetical protein
MDAAKYAGVQVLCFGVVGRHKVLSVLQYKMK